MNDSVNAGSTPVSTVVIGAASLDDSLACYRDAMGLEVIEMHDWSGEDFENYWHLPPGSGSRSALLGFGPDPIGRILLIEFDAQDRKTARSPDQRRAIGLFNLNFYSRNLAEDYRKLCADGFEFWSKPEKNSMGPGGEYIEAVMDGPDGVVINLVQLLTKDPGTFVGGVRAGVEKYGSTSKGFTPVATTAHGVHSIDRALAFYDAVLGMEIAMDNVLGDPGLNRFHGLPEHAQTRSVFIYGDHLYGKILLSSPMNYEIGDMTDAAVPPNIGYLTQSFRVADLDAAGKACASVDTEVFTAPMQIDLPGQGSCRAMIVRNPGSGALQELFERC